MSCREFWNAMPELSRSGDLAHLRDCSSCSAIWEQQRAISAGLRSVAREWNHLQAPARLEGRLTAAFRANSGFTHRVHPARLWVPALTWACAAAALLAFAVFLLNSHPPQAQAPRRSS